MSMGMGVSMRKALWFLVLGSCWFVDVVRGGGGDGGVGGAGILCRSPSTSSPHDHMKQTKTKSPPSKSLRVILGSHMV